MTSEVQERPRLVTAVYGQLGVNVHTVRQKQRRQNANFLCLRSGALLLSHLIIDAIAESIPRILLVPNVVLKSQFSRNQW